MAESPSPLIPLALVGTAIAVIAITGAGLQTFAGGGGSGTFSGIDGAFFLPQGNVSQWIFNDSAGNTSIAMLAAGSTFLSSNLKCTSTPANATNDFEFGCTSNWSVASGTFMTNQNMTLWFNSSLPIVQVSPTAFLVVNSTYQCPISSLFTTYCQNGVEWDAGAMIAEMENYSLVANQLYFTTLDANNNTVYNWQLVLTNFSATTPVTTSCGLNSSGLPQLCLKFDPLAFNGGKSFVAGALNLTQAPDSVSVYAKYYPNDSFSPNGTFFGNPIHTNFTYNGGSAQVVNFVNWSWFEDNALTNVSDFATTDYHFEGDVKDDSPVNNTGYAFNVTYNKTGCIDGQCIFFNGSQSWVNITNWTSGFQAYGTGFPNAPGFTVNVWVYPNNTAGGQEDVIDNLYQPVASPSGFRVALNQTGVIFEIGTGSGALVDYFAKPLRNNTWTMITAILNNTQNDGTLGPSIYLYINGTSVANASLSAPTPYAQNTFCSAVLGADAGADVGLSGTCEGSGQGFLSNTFNGSMDEFSYFNRSFVAKEVNALFLRQYNNTGMIVGNNQFVHNATNVTVAVRAVNYTFNDSGLMLWLTLGNSNDNETLTGETLDASGNGNNGAVGPGVGIVPQGVFGNALNFTGTAGTNYVNMTNGIFNLSQNINLTICFWANPNSTAASLFMAVDNAQVASRVGVSAYFDNAEWNFDFRNDTFRTLMGGAAGETGLTNAWTFLCGQWDASTQPATGRLYINGTSIQNVTATASAATIKYPQLELGLAASGVDPFKGKLGDLYIWNRTLSAAEIKSLYNGGNPQISVGGQESNWSAWSPDYINGNGTVTGISGVVVQYRANFTATSTNYSAFLSNVSITYGLTPAAATLVNVSLFWPYNNSVFASPGQNFSYIPILSTGAVNATLWANFSGWAANNTNASAITNNSLNWINVTGIAAGTYVWNVQVCTGQACNFSANNYTITLLPTAPICVQSNVTGIYADLHLDNNTLDYGPNNLPFYASNNNGTGAVWDLPLQFAQTACISGQCLNFTDTPDGSGNWGPNVGYNLSQATNFTNATFSTWIKPEDYGNGYGNGGIGEFLMSDYPSAPTAAGAVYYTAAGSNTQIGLDESQDGFQVALFNVALPDGNWHMVTVVFNQTGVVGYWDGQPKGYVANAHLTGGKYISPFSPLSGIYFGDFFEGFMDEIHIFNYTLNSTQASSLYTSELAGTETPNYCPLPSFPIYSTLVSPANNSNVTGVPVASGNVNFTYYANSSDGSFGDAILYSNFSGSWAANVSNQSVMINGSSGINFLNVTGISQGVYIWNVFVNDSHNSTFAPNNFTLVVDRTNPLPALQVVPTNNSYSSSLLVNFSYVPRDANTGAANTTLWIFNSTGVVTNTTVNATITNGSMVTNLVFLPAIGTYNWTVTTCDYANNCVNTTFANFVADNVPPTTTIQVSPINSTNQSSLFVNFSFIPQDPFIGLFSTTLYVVNRTGVITNVTLNSTVTNGTEVNILLGMPRTGIYNWTVQDCNLALLCTNTTFGNFTIDNVAPPYFVAIMPATGSSWTKIVNVTFIPGDDLTGLANITTFFMSLTGSGSNFSFLNTSPIANGSSFSTNFTIAANGTYNITEQLCDFANNCANYTDALLVAVAVSSSNYYGGIFLGIGVEAALAGLYLVARTKSRQQLGV